MNNNNGNAGSNSNAYSSSVYLSNTPANALGPSVDDVVVVEDPQGRQGLVVPTRYSAFTRVVENSNGSGSSSQLGVKEPPSSGNAVELDSGVDRQRLESEVITLMRNLDEERKENQELRLQNQQLLLINSNNNGDKSNNDPNTSSLNMMYSSLLRNYQSVSDEANRLRAENEEKREVDQQLEKTQEELRQSRKLAQDAQLERNQLKQQCTQAIRQWDAALRERNELKDALGKVQQQHEEAVKEVNQAMTVRIKASKDIKRLTEERNAALQEYSLIMSERDSVHREIEKLQEENVGCKAKLSGMQDRLDAGDDDKRKLVRQIEMLKRELEQSLFDRDNAIKDAFDLREKVGLSGTSGFSDSSSLFEAGGRVKAASSTGRMRPHKSDVHSGSSDTLDTLSSSLYGVSASTKRRSTTADSGWLSLAKPETLDQALAEVERLRKTNEKCVGEIQDAQLEADVAKGRRDWAFSERDKVVLERESIRTLCDKLRRERDRAVSELAEALRDADDVGKKCSETSKENKELRERLESAEKELQLRLLAPAAGSPLNYRSHDSAIDNDLHEFTTELVYVDLSQALSENHVTDGLEINVNDNHNNLGFQENMNQMPYVSAVSRGSFMEHKLLVNDVLLRINDIDCRQLELLPIMHMLRNPPSLDGALELNQRKLHILVKRRKPINRRCEVVVSVARNECLGLTLDHGVYVSGIIAGSAVAKEASIAVGDRIIAINGIEVEHVDNLNDVLKLLVHSKEGDRERRDDDCTTFHFTLAKSSASLATHHSITIDNQHHEAFPTPGGGEQTMTEDIIQDIERQRCNSKERIDIAGGVKGKLDSAKNRTKKARSSSKDAIATESRDNLSSPHDSSQGHRSKSSSKGGLTGNSQQNKSLAVISQIPSFTNISQRVFLTAEDSAQAEPDSSLEVTQKRTMPNSSQQRYQQIQQLLPKHLEQESSKGKNKNDNVPKAKTSKKKKKRNTQESQDSGHQLSSTSHPNYPTLRNYGGGTWPRSKGGPVIEHTTGTILHPHKVKKERMPLAELLHNLPKYQPPPPPVTTSSVTVATTVPSSTTVTTTTTTSRSGDSLQHFYEARGRMRSKSEKLFTATNMVVLPSDTSIDDSVRSGHANKDVLEKYLKKKPSSTSPSVARGHNYDPLHSRVYGKQGSPFRQHQGRLAWEQQQQQYSGVRPYNSNNSNGAQGEIGLAKQSPSSSRQQQQQYRSYSTNENNSSLSRQSFGHYSPVHLEATQQQQHRSQTPVRQVTGAFQLPAPQAPPTSPFYSNNVYARSGMGASEAYYGVSRGRGSVEPHETHSQRFRASSSNSLGSSQGSLGLPRTTTTLTTASGLSPLPLSLAASSSTSSVGNGSPLLLMLPFYSVHYVTPDGRLVPDSGRTKPMPGDIRKIDIEKSVEPLGIKIDNSSSGFKGVFVSSVADHSLAAQVGLMVGDQLLEISGINLRNCDKEKAALVLHQLKNNISMKVQFNPDDFNRHQHEQLGERQIRESTEDSESDDDHERRPSMRLRQPLVERSGSPTPINSPQASFRSQHQHQASASSSSHSTLTRRQIHQLMTTTSTVATPTTPPSSLSVESRRARASPPYEPRLLFPVLKKSGDLGVRLIGGNHVGIFVHSVEVDSAAFIVGLRSADQILEYNGQDLRRATAEQAAYELAKPAVDNVSVLVQYNPDRYEMIKDQPGDSFFVRCLFDRAQLSIEHDSEHDLVFHKGDVLHIDNTMYNGIPGQWSAWMVTQDGHCSTWGVIPSKYKVEEDLLLKQSLGDASSLSSDAIVGSSRRAWKTSARRSFFKRNKSQSRSTSRSSTAVNFYSSHQGSESKELASYSDVAGLLHMDSDLDVEADEDLKANINRPIQSYLRVQKLDHVMLRPVLIVGPLSDSLSDRLISDFPHKFMRPMVQKFASVPDDMDPFMALSASRPNNSDPLLDARRRGAHCEALTLRMVRDVAVRGKHCVLNVGLESLERLHCHQIYPIVLLMKYKSVKQIKEVSQSSLAPSYMTSTASSDKVWMKDAKNVLEHSHRLETELGHLISDAVHASTNIMLMMAQVANKIETEQGKVLWVPSGAIW